MFLTCAVYCAVYEHMQFYKAEPQRWKLTCSLMLLPLLGALIQMLALRRFPVALRPGNRADGRPSLCSSSFAGGFRVAGGLGALHEESVGGADVQDQARVGSLSGTKVGRPGVNSRIQDGVFVNSSGASSRACVSYLDALLAAPARALAASTAARRFAPPSGVVGLCMHDDGSPVHDACSNSWSDTG